MGNDALLMPDETNTQKKSSGGDEPNRRNDREKFARHATTIIEGEGIGANRRRREENRI